MEIRNYFKPTNKTTSNGKALPNTIKTPIKKNKEVKLRDDIEKTKELYIKYLTGEKMKKGNGDTIYSTKSIDDEIDYIQDSGYTFIRNRLINIYLLTNNSICKIIRGLRYTNPPLLLTDIERKPFSFITFEYQLLTFDRAMTIKKYNNLCVSDDIIKETWIIHHFIKKEKALYIKKKELRSHYITFCEEFDYSPEDVLKVKFIKRKLINKTQYFTTDHFINMEVDMTDKFLELFNCDNRLSAYDCIESFENSGDRYSKKDSIQQRGVKCLIEHNFAILTGGPGTGKSTCVVDAIRYCNIDEEHVCICAPTGKAYKELSDKIEKDGIRLNKTLSGTLHKMVFDVFQKINANILKGEETAIPKLIVLDEASMVDIFMFRHLLNYVEMFECRLWVIGDPDQLPPIGAGQPFINIIEFLEDNLLSCDDERGDEYNPIIKLQKNYRCEDIPDVIEKLGKMKRYDKIYTKELVESPNIEWIEIDETDEDIDEQLFKIFQNTNFDWKDKETIIITPQHKESCGCANLNKLIQSRYNKNIASVKPEYKVYKLGDRVVRKENDYTGECIRVNGDQAQITSINREKHTLGVRYDNGDLQEIKIKDFEELFDLFYASTIHKLQGTGKDIGYLFISKKHSMWWNEQSWTLLYTAISRIKKKLIIIGNPKQFLSAQKKSCYSKPSIFMKEGFDGI
tara:strand:- start:217 stop:2262 length:2046 start_codon:yes stop_codon:yes gene_type:complete